MPPFQQYLFEFTWKGHMENVIFKIYLDHRVKDR